MSEDSIRTRGEFHRALHELVETAHERGVDVEGCWPVEGVDGGRSWDVEIVDLLRPDRDDLS